MFTGFLKGLLEDSPEKEETSDSGKRKRSTIEFDIKPDEVSLVTIPGNLKPDIDNSRKFFSFLPLI